MKANTLIPRLWLLISLLFTIHITAQNNIIGYEYAFDDGSPPTYVSISPTQDFNLVTDIDVSSLTNDVNVFYIRFLDDVGQWSSIVSKIFVRPAQAITNASTIVGYEYGFDNNNPPTYVSIAPSQDFNLISDIDVSSLTNDVNVFHIRFQDDIGQWSSVVSKIFVKPPEATTNASTIVGYEYGFNDLELIQYVPVSPTADFNLISDIDINSLTNDVNVFHIRFKDDIGQWSSFVSKIFVKPQETIAAASTIVGYEYAFNNAQNTQYIPISPAVDFNLVTDIDVSSLTNDVNVFHIRFKDDIGQWSAITSKIFAKPPDTFVSASTIVGYEYSFNDNNTPIYISVSANANINLVANIDISSLTNDINIFHIRFQDDIGQWSSIISKLFVKPPETETFPGNTIVGYDYWFDDDMSSKVSVAVSPSQTNFVLASDLDVTRIWAGEHTVNIQFKDDYNHYSVVATDTINKTLLTIADFTPNTTSICQGESVYFSNHSIDFDTVSWDFGDGNTSTDNNPIHTFNTSGTFDVELTVTDSSSGMDSIATQSIQVFSLPLDTVTLSFNPMTLTSNQAGATYQWIDCNNGNLPIDGETNQSFLPSVDGDYAVEITLNGCTIISSCTSALSVDDLSLDGLVKLYPNPVNNQLNIKSDIPLQVDIFNLNGIKIQSVKLDNGLNTIKMNRFSSGLYIFKITEMSKSGMHRQSIYRILKD